MTPTTRTLRIAWRAARDGVAHASRSNGIRTLCDLPVVAERLAWPEQRRCMGCTSIAIDMIGSGSETETEQRMAWGDR